MGLEDSNSPVQEPLTMSWRKKLADFDWMDFAGVCLGCFPVGGLLLGVLGLIVGIATSVAEGWEKGLDAAIGRLVMWGLAIAPAVIVVYESMKKKR